MATLKTKLEKPTTKLQGGFERLALDGRAVRGERPCVRAGSLSGVWSLVFGAFLLGAALVQSSFAQNQAATPAEAFSNRVYRLYIESKQNWQGNGTNAEAAWQFARACFDWADYATTDAKRAAIADEGIAASRQAIVLEPKSAQAHLYLGMNLGQLARTKLLSALGNLDEMEAAWKKSIELDAKYDHAGAHRSLGLLYLDAPGWPASIGSKKKAREQLEKAVELHPEYPGNRLCLLDALLKWGETKTVLDQINPVEAVLKSARTNLTGEAWARDWQEWDERWQKIKSKAGVANARSPDDR